MPFEKNAARVFTTMSVQKNAPSSSGVYGLSNAREWIYVGESDDVRTRLLEHLQEKNTPLAERNPTGFSFEACSHHDRIARQNRLIRELAPVCNRDPEQRRAGGHLSR